MNNIFKVLAVVITLLLILPKYVGSLVETEHQTTLDKWSENPAINIVKKSFTANWFGGVASTEMVVLLQDDTLEDVTIIVDEVLSFGPIVSTENGFDFALSHSKADVNFKNLEDLDPELKAFIQDKIHITSLFTFSKNIVSTIVIDEITKTEGDNKFHFKQAISEFTLTKNNRVFGEFNWAGMTFEANTDKVEVGQVSFDFDQTLVAGNYHRGDAIVSGYFNFMINNINATDNAHNSALLIENLAMRGESKVVDKLMNFSLTYHADKMESLEDKFNHANLEFVVDALSIDSLQELNKFVASFSSNSDELFSPANMEQLGHIIDKLLSTDPILKITDLSVETPQGKIESSLTIQIDNTLFNVTNTMSIVQALDAQANAKAPEAFILKSGLLPEIDSYIEQGLLRRENDEISFVLNFSKGQLTINGNIIPL